MIDYEANGFYLSGSSFSSNIYYSIHHINYTSVSFLSRY